ncbi:CitMHS family transporter [Arsenicicoccus bolidensis]|uniref:CitMHS family transporter n=1 Tax=Arsenicicoccus bolidensis TaxID=229480 RepID=UPI0028ABDBA5|nr:citrate:proton symporter [Arsenicicoccus bolidensis]
MLTIWGLLIVTIFMVLIMTKRTTPFTALVLSPVLIALIAGFGDKIGDHSLAGVKGVAPTVFLLLFAILYFGLMLTAGLFDPLVRLILRIVKGDPLRVLVGTALLAAVVSVDGDGSTTTMIVCSAMIPVYRRLGMKMMDLAVLVIMANSIMNLLPWGGPTARIIAALKVDEGELLRKLLPGMLIATVWVVIVAVIRGRAERKRLGIVDLSSEEVMALSPANSLIEASNDSEETAHALEHEGEKLKRPHMIWPNFILTMVMMVTLVFGGMWIIPDIPSAIIFEVGFAIALLLNYRKLNESRDIIEIHGANAMHVIVMVLAAGVFMGILNGTGMSEAMGQSIGDVVPPSLGDRWGMVTAFASIPGTFLLSNDAFYLGVLPILAETGAGYGFTPMQIAVASTTGQAFHLLSPLVGFIYLLLHLTGVDMGTWQRTAAKWSIGTFVVFLLCAVTIGGVPI